MKKLVMPNEMGEKFKVFAFSKDFDDELMGFSFSNEDEHFPDADYWGKKRRFFPRRMWTFAI